MVYSEAGSIHLKEGTFLEEDFDWIDAEDDDYWDGYIRFSYHSMDLDHGNCYYPAFHCDYYICKIVAKDPAPRKWTNLWVGWKSSFSRENTAPTASRCRRLRMLTASKAASTKWI